MMTLKRSITSGSSLALALTVVGLLTVASTAYGQALAVLAITYAFLAVGMYVPLALTGQLSLAYNAYFAIGAYSVVLWSNYTEAASLWSVPIAVVISMVAAVILGVSTMKLSGFHLAIATLLFGVAVRQWIISEDEITGGVLGMGGVRPPELFGFVFSREIMVPLGAIAVWLICVCISRVRRSNVGIALRAQRETPAASAAAGFPPRTTNVLSLAVGAGIAALGGCFFAYLNSFVLPDSFTMSLVFLILFMPVLGGLNSPWGAFLGAVVVVAFTEAFAFLSGPGALTFGALTLLTLVLFPGGLLGLAVSGIDRIKSVVARKPLSKATAPDSSKDSEVVS